MLQADRKVLSLQTSAHLLCHQLPKTKDGNMATVAALAIVRKLALYFEKVCNAYAFAPFYCCATSAQNTSLIPCALKREKCSYFPSKTRRSTHQSKHTAKQNILLQHKKSQKKKKRIKDDNGSPNQCGISDYGMGGYNWKKGMSNRAVRAYLKGKVPISKRTRKLLNEYGINITVKKAKDILIYEIGSCEYHHTSKFFNSTDFYNMHSLKEYVKKIRNKEI